MASYVLQIDRSDGQGFVLLNVRSGARNELDIDIEGTEGTVPYVTRLKHHQIAKALHKSSSLSDEEWSIVARCLLLQARPRGSHEATLLQGIEANVQVFDDKLILAFRKNISGIHQRLADLTIPKDEDHELDTIAWVSTAVQRAAALEAEARSLKDETSQQAQAMQKLQEQIQELIQAKDAHEAELFEKFAQLINSKKSKIRDQQRLLNGMSKTPNTRDSARDVPETDLEGTSTTQKLSPRLGKRKSAHPYQDQAHQRTRSSETESDSEASRQETADEDEEDLASEVSPEDLNPLSLRNASTSEYPRFDAPGDPISTRSDTQPPPKRELPFKDKIEALNRPGRRGAPHKAKPSKTRQTSDRLDDDSDNEL